LKSSRKLWVPSHLKQSRGFLPTGSKDWNKWLIPMVTTSIPDTTNAKASFSWNSL
jgi:hypothetical protein